ncbi:oxygenase MpaB family protein [Mucilaginibacter sp. AW1-3]
MMEYFVKQGSVVRQIWGKSDTVLFIFAGSAAEFALNKAVDWLYFTGKLPADPIGRLFSTVAYARMILFADRDQALKAIDQITAIHQQVEANRGAKIPDWAYRDVLFMLIDYSIRSFEVLERPLTGWEKAEVFDTFYRVGNRMGITDLPKTYPDWIIMRREHLEQNLRNSKFTTDLYQQYKKHLGRVRYQLLKQVQQLIVPEKVKQLLQLTGVPYIKSLLALYKLSRLIRIDTILKSAMLPEAYKKQILALDEK